MFQASRSALLRRKSGENPRRFPPQGNAHQDTTEPALTAFRGYNAIAEWVEANNYALASAVRLVLLELPKQPGDDDFVMEIQFPIRKQTVDWQWSMD